MSAALAQPRSLFDIGEDFKRWHAILDESGGEIAPEDEQAMEAWYQSLELEESTKAGNWVSYVNMLQAEADSAKQWADFFQKKCQSRTNRILAMKARMMEYLASQGKGSINTDRGVKIAIRANSAKPLLVNGSRLDTVRIRNVLGQFEACDSSGNAVVIDEMFVRAKYELNTELIKDAIKNGKAPEVFEYGVAGSHIRIV